MFLSDTYAKNDCVLTEKYISMFPRSIKRISKVHRIIFATWKFGTQEFQQHRFAGNSWIFSIGWRVLEFFPNVENQDVDTLCVWHFPLLNQPFLCCRKPWLKSRKRGTLLNFPGTLRSLMAKVDRLSRGIDDGPEKSYLIRMSLCHGEDLIKSLLLKYSK